MNKSFACSRQLITVLVLSTVVFSNTLAQRMSHGEGNKQRAQPSTSQRTINGGSVKSQNRPGGRPQASTGLPAQRPQQDIKGKPSNKVSVDNSKKNVNINVDNSKNVNINHRNTVVIHNHYRPYPRPPYRFGGRSYYCFHPYFYHPYHPYYRWHPWGFFVATMATTAVIISIESQRYYYDQGIYYISSNGGYVVVQAPVGATITTLPANTQTVVVTETVNNYYYGGTYYEKTDKGYTVVPPTAGTIVETLPEGGEEVKIGEMTYVKIGETYYQPIQQDGKNMYEVVEVKEE